MKFSNFRIKKHKILEKNVLRPVHLNAGFISVVELVGQNPEACSGMQKKSFVSGLRRARSIFWRLFSENFRCLKAVAFLSSEGVFDSGLA